MNNNLGSITVDGKNVDLNSASMEEIKQILEKVNNEEVIIKQELDNMIKILN